jgi:hypothetical protein
MSRGPDIEQLSSQDAHPNIQVNVECKTVALSRTSSAEIFCPSFNTQWKYE